MQVSVTVSSNVDGYPGLYLWDYGIDNISVQSPDSDGYVNGVGGFAFAFPEAMADLANISVVQNWNANITTNSDGTTALYAGSNGGSDPNPLTAGTPEPIYALSPGQSMHISFTTLLREVMNIQGCSNNSNPSSCAQALKAIVLILAQRRHAPLGQLASGSGAVSDGGLRLSLGAHAPQSAVPRPKLVRVQAVDSGGSCSTYLDSRASVAAEPGRIWTLHGQPWL